MKLPKLFGVTALVAVLVSCASTENRVPQLSEFLRETTGQNGRACVRSMDIQGYGVRKNDVISIDARRRYYLATVHPGCTDLATSAAAMFSGDFYEVCGGRMDRVITRDNQCTINRMFEFENREEAFGAYEKAMQKREETRDEVRDPE